MESTWSSITAFLFSKESINYERVAHHRDTKQMQFPLNPITDIHPYNYTRTETSIMAVWGRVKISATYKVV
jgi:hypothetical protein